MVLFAKYEQIDIFSKTIWDKILFAALQCCAVLLVALRCVVALCCAVFLRFLRFLCCWLYPIQSLFQKDWQALDIGISSVLTWSYASVVQREDLHLVVQTSCNYRHFPHTLFEVVVLNQRFYFDFLSKLYHFIFHFNT